jgi:hypothetical protein
MAAASLNSSCVLFSDSSAVVAVGRKAGNEAVKWLGLITFLKLVYMYVCLL